MRIGETAAEQEVTLFDGMSFIESQAVAASDDTWGYRITGPEDRVIFIDAGTEVAPELRDSNGDPLDDSTRVIIQKCNKQGDAIGDAIALSELLGKFDYEQFRTDEDYTRSTSKALMIDEHEIVKVFVDVPEGANAFDPAQSTLTIGDDTSDFGTPVEIVDHSDLSSEESAAVKAASQRGGGN